MARPSIVLTSRELFPFGGGGIGAYIAATARCLAPVADVTILTASWYEPKFRELVALGDPRVDYGGARVEFVPVPEAGEHGAFYAHMHLYSHRLLERLRALFGSRGPDLVEFPDYLGEGFVPAQARRGGDGLLARTRLAVRLHTSAEMCHVLNGRLDRSFSERAHREIERYVLGQADVLLHAGGRIRETYEGFYGTGALAPGRRVRHPYEFPDAEPAAPAGEGPLRILYTGRLERRKGVQDLVEALTSFSADWRLTLLGADTATAPLGRSMRRTLELQAAGDHRITFAEPVARAALPAEMARHDVVVLPSRWECWPYVALEALAAGVPLLGPDVGGLAEMVVPGQTGWLAAGTGALALADVLGPLVAEPARARELRAAGAIRPVLEGLTDPDAIRAAYLGLAREGERSFPSGKTGGNERSPLVTVVIPYFGMHRYVREAVASVLAQTCPRIEVLVVDDGSFAPEDVVLAEIAARDPVRVICTANRGLGGARNFGISQARGRYVLPLDPDNVLEREFVARCVALLEADEDLPYVTSWNRYVEEDGTPYPEPNLGYRPLGNWSPLVEERNVAGDGTAVFRRSLFAPGPFAFSEDLTAYEDWALYRELHRAGRFGLVIPEMLWRYRIRSGSMLQEGIGDDERLQEEMDALVRGREAAWA